MTIISLSLNDNIIKQMDKIEEEMGFSGRSEATRAAIRLLIAEHEKQKKLQGILHATLIIVHDEDASETVAHIRHQHAKIIKTQLHDHLNAETCVEIFMLHGDGKDIAALAKKFGAAKGIARSTLTIL